MAQPMPQEAPQEQPQAGGEEQLIQMAGHCLAKINEMVGQSQAPDQLKQMAQQLLQGFSQFAQALEAGGAEEQAAPQGGPVPMETGGRPSSPAL